MTQPDNPDRETISLAYEHEGSIEEFEIAADPSELSDRELLDEIETIEGMVWDSPLSENIRTLRVCAQIQMRFTAELARRTLGDTDD